MNKFAELSSYDKEAADHIANMSMWDGAVYLCNKYKIALPRETAAVDYDIDRIISAVKSHYEKVK